MRLKDMKKIEELKLKYGARRWRKKIKIRKNYPFGQKSSADFTFIVKENSSPLTSSRIHPGGVSHKNTRRNLLDNNEIKKQKGKHYDKSTNFYHGSRGSNSLHWPNK